MLLKLLILLLCEHIFAYDKPFYDVDLVDEYFSTFLINYNVSYEDQDEYMKRKKTFKNNLKQINILNEEEPDAVFKINRFSDLTSEEFVAQHTGYKAEKEGPIFRSNHKPGCRLLNDNDIDTDDAPDQLDWRVFHAVTRVRDQVFCGSCWAFSAIGAIEGAYAVKHDALVELSEQQILDCSNAGDCTGGSPVQAMKSAKIMRGLVSEEDYTYKRRKNACTVDWNNVVVKVTDCVQFMLHDEELLKEVLAHYGPLSIAMDSKAPAIQHYTSGVVRNCKMQDIDHALVLVGYGTDNNVPYWIIKNSYGTDWGEEGYLRVMRGINACGLTAEVSTVTVK